jgi:hypothetical protein
MRGTHRIKEATYRRKQEGAFGRGRKGLQPLDIPLNFLTRMPAGGRGGACGDHDFTDAIAPPFTPPILTFPSMIN